MKMKLKVTKVLTVSLIIVSIMAISTTAIAAKPDPSLMINIMAKGDDMDIPGYDLGIYRATTLIVGKIRFDEVSGVLLGRVEFHIKIYEIESGEKVYTIKGKLKDGAVALVPQYPCLVRNVIWTDVWLVQGEGMIKTTDIVIENFEYRGNIITLPNTEGIYVPAFISMMVSPNGDCIGVWEDGGWAFTGVLIGAVNGNPQFFGGVTSLINYMEKSVP